LGSRFRHRDGPRRPPFAYPPAGMFAGFGANIMTKRNLRRF
jgi:hypothetical protein